MNRTRIIFMGTPAFAVATLDAMINAGHAIVAVVTAPDKPAGRGRKARASAVKERALELGLPVLQPERLRDPAFLNELDRIDATLYIVVAFRMLPESVWSRPPLGTVNLHASLLPDYRGAAPINWAVINGEQRTGVTTFLIRHAIDTGDILLQEELPIGPEETAGELHDRMMVQGAELMVRTVDGLIEGSLRPRPQTPLDGMRSAPKIDAESCRISFEQPARTVHDLVRGMSPHPGAWCHWTEDERPSAHFKILRTRRTSQPSGKVIPGTVRIEADRFLIACSDHWLEALEVQLEGKRRMATSDLVRGLRTGNGIRLV